MFSFNWVYFTKNNENLLEKGSNAMVNGMKNHKKKLRFAYLPQSISKFHDLSNRAIALKLMLFHQINQVSGINPRTYKRK